MTMHVGQLETVDRCTECHLRSSGFFCALSQKAVRAFDEIKRTYIYPRAATLFVEGQSSNGIYVLCRGRVKLSTCASDGRMLILRIIEPGEVLGLSAAVTSTPYEVTAVTIEPCQANFVQREEFIQFLSHYKDALFNVARHLSHYCHHSYAQIRTLGLSNSAAEKLARLLLGWCANGGEETGRGLLIKRVLTHEEIAGMIGTSRETVSRIFADFKDKRLLNVRGTELIVLDQPGLEDIANG